MKSIYLFVIALFLISEIFAMEEFFIAPCAETDTLDVFRGNVTEKRELILLRFQGQLNDLDDKKKQQLIATKMRTIGKINDPRLSIPERANSFSYLMLLEYQLTNLLQAANYAVAIVELENDPTCCWPHKTLQEARSILAQLKLLGAFYR